MRLKLEVETETAEEWLQDWRDRVDRRRFALGRSIAELALQRIVEGNPVDTGRSRAAWVAGGQQASLNVSGAGQGGDPQATSAGMSAGTGRMEEEEGRSWYEIVNTVDYVPFLEYGTQRMPAAAMVRASLWRTASDARAALSDLMRGGETA